MINLFANCNIEIIQLQDRMIFCLFIWRQFSRHSFVYLECDIDFKRQKHKCTHSQLSKERLWLRLQVVLVIKMERLSSVTRIKCLRCVCDGNRIDFMYIECLFLMIHAVCKQEISIVFCFLFPSARIAFDWRLFIQSLLLFYTFVFGAQK